MKSYLRCIVLFLLCIAFGSAEPPGIDQSLEFVTPPAGKKFIRWFGKLGRTYFVMVSDPADHLNTWKFAPIVEAGNDHEISYEVDGTADKGFFRLKYTDQVPGPGETLETADFDHDGISNWNEITANATDPLAFDTTTTDIPMVRKSPQAPRRSTPLPFRSRSSMPRRTACLMTVLVSGILPDSP